jgi:hypothetical protein
MALGYSQDQPLKDNDRRMCSRDRIRGAIQMQLSSERSRRDGSKKNGRKNHDEDPNADLQGIQDQAVWRWIPARPTSHLGNLVRDGWRSLYHLNSMSGDQLWLQDQPLKADRRIYGRDRNTQKGGRFGTDEAPF